MLSEYHAISHPEHTNKERHSDKHGARRPGVLAKHNDDYSKQATLVYWLLELPTPTVGALRRALGTKRYRDVNCMLDTLTFHIPSLYEEDRFLDGVMKTVYLIGDLKDIPDHLWAQVEELREKAS